MNRSEIRDQIRFLSLVEEHEVSDDQLDTLINEGYAVLESKGVWAWAVSTKPSKIETQMGVERYNLPVFSQIITIMKHDGTRELRSSSIQEITKYAHEIYAEPELFTVDSGDIVLTPIPDDNCYEYDIFYTHLPCWPCDDGVPPFDKQFHMMLTDWALHRIWEREENFERSTEYRSRFETRALEMEAFYNARVQDRPLIFGESYHLLRRSFEVTNMNCPI